VLMAIVLMIAKLVNYRPGAIAPLLAVMFAIPVVLFEVEVGRDDRSLMVTAETTQLIGLEALYDPDGEEVLYWEDWYYEDTTLTNAFFFWGRDMTFNWPVRAQDGPLQRGTWSLEVAVLTSDYYYVDGAEVRATVQTNRDDALDQGTVHARIVYAEGVDENDDVVAALEEAVERWRELYEAFGLVLDESYDTSDMDADLPYVGEGDNAIASETARGDGTQVTVIIGEVIDGQGDLYGTAGNIPGSLAPTGRSAVAISWLANAGTDGVFSEDDTRLFGETLAHEVGHYLGLYHPVETTWSTYDALDDTVECTNASRCEDELGENLLFPYPICTWNGCAPQSELSGDQVGVTQRYTGTQ